MTDEGMEQYLSAFKHGMPPHGGLGIGMERLTMKMMNEDNVRETTLFPRDLSRLEPQQQRVWQTDSYKECDGKQETVVDRKAEEFR